jgi:hypothetical protein
MFQWDILSCLRSCAALLLPASGPPVEETLAADLEVHEAKLRALDSEILVLEETKIRCARSGKMDQAKSAIRERRAKEEVRAKTRELRDFYRGVMNKIELVADVHRAMSTMGQARRRVFILHKSPNPPSPAPAVRR